jgi:hypothetical protein
MNCIYTAFYTNLKSYDGNEVNKQRRLEMLDLCVSSFKRFNPETPVIVDIIDEVVNNTADMYFDKMSRIKDLNYNYNVLWVDADTLCLENVSELFSYKMSGAFWGHWDGMNVANGGVIHYPKRFLYNNYSTFVKNWISLLSSLNDSGEKFIGPNEQFPITDLLLSQMNGCMNSYSIWDHEQELINSGVIFDIKYNTNPFIRHNDDKSVFNECNNICGKKILHVNTSSNDVITVEFCKYITDNLLGYTSNPYVLLNRCKQLRVTNEFLSIDRKDLSIRVSNNVNAYVELYVFKDESRDLKNSVHHRISPGYYYGNDNISNTSGIVIKNILSGEVKVINF